MAHKLFTIKNRSTFLMIRENGNFLKGKNLNIQFLHTYILEKIQKRNENDFDHFFHYSKI